jgi:hypothetical protein
MSLRDFLEAHLAEDEAMALAAKRATSGRWRWDHGTGEMCNDPTCPYGELVAIDGPYDVVLMDVHGYDTRGDEPWNGSEHIARHDPARVLREVEAKRALLARHAREEHWVGHADAPSGRFLWRVTCSTCRDGSCEDDYDATCGYSDDPCIEVRLLGAVYRDHPDYPAWAPEATT